MRKGGILLSLHADDQEWVEKGKKILQQTGAEDISSIGETKGDFGNTDRPTSLVEPAFPVAVAAPVPVAVPVSRGGRQELGPDSNLSRYVD